MVVHLVHIRRNKNEAEDAIEFARQTDVRVGELCGQYKKGLVNHHRIHGRSRHHNAREEKNAAKNAFHRVVTQAGGYVHIVVCVMDHMKPPHPRHLVFGNVNEPSAEKIEGKRSDQNSEPYGRMEPVHHTNVFCGTEVTKQNDQDCETGVQYKMHNCKREVYGSVPPFCFPVLQLQQWDCPFYKPQEQHAAHEEQHAFHRALLQCLEIFDEGVHGRNRVR